MVKNKRKLIVVLILVLALGGLLGYVAFGKDKPLADTPEPVRTAQSSGQFTQDPPPAFDKSRYSIDDPNSLWVIVNKKRPLPSGFVPEGLTSVDGVNLKAEAARAVEQLMTDAEKSQVQFKVISGYRSYQSQQSVYQSYVRTDGQADADTYSARPGYSEHQTGLVADLGNINGSCDLEICFANTAGGKWLVEHAHEYGFIIRYLESKTPVTGYQYEPWHIRYVGKELASEIKNSGQTMEEFFGLPAASQY